MNAKNVEQAFKKRVKESAGTNPSFKPRILYCVTKTLVFFLFIHFIYTTFVRQLSFLSFRCSSLVNHLFSYYILNYIFPGLIRFISNLNQNQNHTPFLPFPFAPESSPMSHPSMLPQFYLLGLVVLFILLYFVLFRFVTLRQSLLNPCVRLFFLLSKSIKCFTPVPTHSFYEYAPLPVLILQE